MEKRLAFVLTSALALGCAGASDKAPYGDDPDLDEAGGKSDRYTSKMDVLGSIRYGDTLEHEYTVGRYAAFAFEATEGDRIDIRVDSEDADPVLLLYGPQRPNGTWGRKLVLRDDDIGLSPHLTDWTVARTGTYLILTGDYYKHAGEFSVTLGCPSCTVDPVFACEADTDCVEVQTTCCPCSSGGRTTAVNREHESDLRPTCDLHEPIACMAVYMCTGDTAQCIDGTCTMAPPPSEGQFCGGIAGLGCPDGQRCALDGDFPDAGGHCVIEACARTPELTETSPRYGRFEAPGFANGCTADADCMIGGCSGEVCAAEGVITTCEAISGTPAGSCGCIAGECRWWTCGE